VFGVDFELLSEIRERQVIATGREIRELARLRKEFGPGRWRKMKGIATVELLDGTIAEAEVHWYEAHGQGSHLMKIKRFLDD
jgi:hypothetical protein